MALCVPHYWAPVSLPLCASSGSSYEKGVPEICFFDPLWGRRISKRKGSVPQGEVVSVRVSMREMQAASGAMMEK